MKFDLQSPFTPAGDQPEAIAMLEQGLKTGLAHQVLLGVTGSGKTYTMANVIARLGRPALVISHNKTLAAQLYQEFRDFFPKNAVSYFVSYYDYYQPEAYIPQSDTYIEKETEINDQIDKLRLAATTNLLTRRDTIIVASVSCIYNIGSPREYGNFVLELKPGVKIAAASILARLTDLQYERSEYGFHRGTFRSRGEFIDLFPAYEDSAIRIGHDKDKVTTLTRLDPTTGKVIETLPIVVIYPAKHYMTDPTKHRDVFTKIQADLAEQVKWFKDRGKLLEAHRIAKRVNFDLEMISEIGYVNGIENYSRYFDNRSPGDPPYTLLDYFREPYAHDWLLFIDESHMTIPQIRGMYNGDRSRKQTLVDYGFRLPAALDNRPLTFDEFQRRIPQTIYVSATPDEWEMSLARSEAGKLKLEDRRGIVEQIVRPTGLVDPEISVRPAEGQIRDLAREIMQRKKKGERALVTTLTKRMAEDLTKYLSDAENLKKLLETPENIPAVAADQLPIVHYLHSDIETLRRSDILDDLRLGKYDVLVGVNLLREGLDLPEVSLVAILDADKEGFLRSSVSLVQTMGRAARHIHGQVIMYADTTTGSMERAIEEIRRRREIQLHYNQKHQITPQTIKKPIREKLVDQAETEAKNPSYQEFVAITKHLNVDEFLPDTRKKVTSQLKRLMRDAARDLNFELAAEIRDKIRALKNSRT